MTLGPQLTSRRHNARADCGGGEHAARTARAFSFTQRHARLPRPERTENKATSASSQLWFGFCLTCPASMGIKQLSKLIGEHAPAAMARRRIDADAPLLQGVK